ncbi:hypothetical protein, partial [Bacillus sp. REN3]|uniref:hypothetical protein n=1 Tax=Bacillus sp. REN3 TaxID=2802440 RepID=UPI001AEE79F7
DDYCLLTLVCLVFKEQLSLCRPEATLIIYHAVTFSSISFFKKDLRNCFQQQLLYNNNIP